MVEKINWQRQTMDSESMARAPAPVRKLYTNNPTCYARFDDSRLLHQAIVELREKGFHQIKLDQPFAKLARNPVLEYQVAYDSANGGGIIHAKESALKAARLIARDQSR